MHLHATGPETSEAERFGLLVRLGFVSREEVAAAAAEAGRTGESVASILAARYAISKHSLGCALQAHYGVPFIAYDRNLPTEREAAEEAGAAHLRAHLWVPLLSSGGELYVLTDDPSSAAKAAAIRGALPGRRIRFYVGLPDDILAHIIKLEREGLLRPARDRRRDVLLALALLFLALGLQKDAPRSGAAALRLPRLGTIELIDARPAAAFTTGARSTLEFPQGPGLAAALHKADLSNLIAARSAPVAATTTPPTPPPPPAPRLGKGELVNAAAIAAASGAALEEVLALRESGLGWGVIAQNLGSTLGRDRQAFKGGVGVSSVGGSGKGRGPGVGPKPGSPAQPSGQFHGKGPKVK